MPWTRPQVDLHAGSAEAMDQYNTEDHHYEGSLFPASTLIPVTVICILIFIIGVTGNTMTILIIQHFKDMKTTTNLYLSSMAVSDLIIFLCLPFDLYRLWNFPLKSKVVVTRRRVQYIIFALWVFALVSAAPTLFLVGVEYDNVTHPDYNTGQCKHTDYAIISGQLHIMLWVSTTYFFCPMLCLIFLYGSIGCKLWKSKNDLQGPCALARERSHRQTVKILVVVVLAFIICWLPYHIGRNLFAQVDDYETAMLSQNFNMASMVLCYLSASINPVVYNLMSRKYRAAAKRLFLLHQRPRQAHRSQRQLCVIDHISTLNESLTGV
ncbi:Growth hormone secretagogue receptor type 1 [Collichthys lucidus]|uniref:Growth hormone secretagogue receptor type 1 n=1 Tax=Collichthys lucidus TaxID=240159 RepID=A0A4U5UZP4_COLLU|nr:Growth hormone secretagogue receptor type 1 [Collichthys lucidus]